MARFFRRRKFCRFTAASLTHIYWLGTHLALFPHYSYSTVAYCSSLGNVGPR